MFGLLATMTAMADGEFPKLSKGSEEYWYYIEMQRGKTVLTSFSNFGKIQTAAVDANNKDKQLWKITQNDDGSYSITSRYVDGGTNWKLLYKSGTYLRFRSRKNKVDADEYKDFEIVPTTYSGSENLEGFEIKVKGLNAAEDKNYLNQNGDYGAGVELGCWKPGNPNNVLKFIAEEDMPLPDAKPADVSEVSISGSTTWQPENKHTLWYTQPGTVWMTSSLPIGNGQFGGTILGGVKRDDIQFNDKTLWSGHLNGLEANASFGCYLNFGHLYITTTDAAAATNYRRWLDLDEGKAGVAYTSGGVDYEREYIASYPDDVIAIRYKASQNGKINTSIILFNMNGNAPIYSVSGTTGVATFSGTVNRTSAAGTVDPESFYCQARVATSGGTISATSSGITVTGANEMTIYLRGMTNFSPDNDDYIYDATQLPSKVQTCLTAAVNKGYEAIKTAHVADYKNLYDRCQLTLTTAGNTITTPNLINAFKNNPASNLLLEEMYFTYGRYLLISSSRGVALPANLQGIWNHSNNPDWHSDIHADINVQMNYWPAEITNLSELHSTFTDYVYREACQRSQWKNNANGVGWAIPTENNIYGGGSTFAWSLNNKNTRVANAWYCMHMWQHYRYTLDLDFLRNKAWPVMKSCCDYWLGKLIQGSDGKYECPDEWSPEWGPMENATAYSQQLVWDLFNNTLLAYDELNDNSIVDANFMTNLRAKFAKLDQGVATEVVGGKTLLREWKYTSQSSVPNNNNNTYETHRHMSHLVGLHPGNQIAEEINPEIYAAAKQSVISRGLAGTGWSMGWKINLNARIGEAEQCHTLLKNALKLTTTTTQQMQGGGVYENLWDAHPPFQIDGNFGACAGIAEMLMQSHLGKIKILPALPTEWATGEIKGLRAVNKFEVDIAWKNGTADIIKIKSEAGKQAVVTYPNIASYCVVKESDGTPVIFNEVSGDEIDFPTEEGETYIIRKGVSVTIGSTGYGTLYYGNKNLIVPANIEGATYKVSGNQLAKSHTYATGSTIPNSTGVVLKADAPAIYTFFETDETEVTDEYSLLRGVDEPGMTTAGSGNDDDYKFFKLTTKNGANVGFYFGAENGAPFQMTTAHKAYLVVPKNVAANVKQFLFDDIPTALEGLTNDIDTFSGVIYDVQGRKLNATTIPMLKKGIYIVSDGSRLSKKIVVK